MLPVTPPAKRIGRIELPTSGWKPEVLPLNYIRTVVTVVLSAAGQIVACGGVSAAVLTRLAPGRGHAPRLCGRGGLLAVTGSPLLRYLRAVIVTRTHAFRPDQPTSPRRESNSRPAYYEYAALPLSHKGKPQPAKPKAPGENRTRDLRDTNALRRRCATRANVEQPCARRGSNPRPPVCKTDALPLSYTRVFRPGCARWGAAFVFSSSITPHNKNQMDATGIEPATACLQDRCSPRLSYTPVLRPRRARLPVLDSNQRPPD